MGTSPGSTLVQGGWLQRPTGPNPVNMLWDRVVKNHMTQPVYGVRISPTEQPFRPNPRDNPHPIATVLPKVGGRLHLPQRISHRDLEHHLTAGDYPRVYIANDGRRIKHLLAVDIDGVDPHASQELGAAIQLWLSDRFGPHAYMAPSTGGRGVHLWMVFSRLKGTSPADFNQTIEDLGQVMLAKFPRAQSDAAWLCL